jgi:hypothetical protein
MRYLFLKCSNALKDLLDPFFDAVKFKSIKDSVGLLSNQLLKAA